MSGLKHIYNFRLWLLVLAGVLLTGAGLQRPAHGFTEPVSQSTGIGQAGEERGSVLETAEWFRQQHLNLRFKMKAHTGFGLQMPSSAPAAPGFTVAVAGLILIFIHLRPGYYRFLFRYTLF